MAKTRKRQDAIREPQQQRSQQRVELILEVCKQLISEKGCAALKMGDIAAAADISIGSIYQYFPNKRAIIEALATHYLDQFRAQSLTMLGEAPDDLEALWNIAMDIHEANYRMHREDPVVRDIWMGSATDKSLQDISEQDRVTTVDEVFELAQHLFKPGKHEEVKEMLSLFLDFGQISVTRAVELDEAAGRRKIEMAKDLLSSCWQGSVMPLAKARKR
jgi:AcrR family transcriptional regulator